MSDKFFDKFPLINYSNSQVIDITRRVALMDKISTNPYVFYPYEITAEERADQLSDRYYDDPYASWLIYLTNKIVDPYYEWYMHEYEFSEYINKKYGSEINAKRKIKYYRNDWSNGSIIDLSAFNALTPGQQKYWEPNIVSNQFAVKNFKRKELDWTTTTNKVVSYNVANSSGFVLDEICTINFSQNKTGKGYVVGATNNIVTLQHMSGFYYAQPIGSPLDYRIKDEEETPSFIKDEDVFFITYEYEGEISPNSYLYGTQSKSNTIFTATTKIASNIADEEEVYWIPVSYYDYEYEKNEYYKSIRVLESNFKDAAVENLQTLLEE